MLDWPEQSQTSPASTLVSISVLAGPETSMSGTGPACCAGSCTLHGTAFPAPRVSATTVPPTLTATFSPSSAQPQNWRGSPLCTAMLLPRIAGSVTAAWAGKLAAHQNANAETPASELIQTREGRNGGWRGGYKRGVGWFMAKGDT